MLVQTFLHSDFLSSLPGFISMLFQFCTQPSGPNKRPIWILMKGTLLGEFYHIFETLSWFLSKHQMIWLNRENRWQNTSFVGSRDNKCNKLRLINEMPGSFIILHFAISCSDVHDAVHPMSVKCFCNRLETH